MAGIDIAASSVTIRTRAKGLLGRLAHDLEIQVGAFDGALTREGATWRCDLTFPVSELRVVGVLKGDKLDRSVLSWDDINQIERKIKSEVLLGEQVRVKASGEGDAGEATVIAPRGEQRVSFSLRREARDAAEIGYGSVTLSLSKLGVNEIKGPLGAFKVADEVAVAFVVKTA